MMKHGIGIRYKALEVHEMKFTIRTSHESPPPIPDELRARMACLDAASDAAWGFGGLDWQVDYDHERNKWACYGRDNLTEINLSYPYK